MSPTLRANRGASTSPIRSRRGWIPALVGAIALALLGLVTFLVGNAQLEAARETRLDDRLGLVARFSMAGSKLYSAQPLIDQAATLPFSPDLPDVSEALLDYFILNPASDPYVEVAVIDAEGELVASRPAATDISRYDLDTALSDALSSGAGLSPVFELDGESVWARTIQLGGDPQQPGSDRGWGALVLIEALEGRWLQNLYHDLGSLGRGDGGLSLVDKRGVAAASWNPDLLGTQVLSQQERDQLTGRVSSWTAEVDDDSMITIGVERDGFAGVSALVFQQSESAFYGDLDAAQQRRSVLTYTALVASLIALLTFTLLRQRLIRREERLASVILDATDDIIALIDEHDCITSVSSGLGRLLGLRPEEWVGRSLVDMAGPEHQKTVTAAIERARQEGIARELSIGLTHVEGEVRWFDLTATDRRDHRHVNGLIVTLTYVGERKALEDRLEYRASHDQLTGLPNRAGFDEQLAEVLAQEAPSMLGVVDLDRFKPLNDRLGHAAGDAALKQVAGVLSGAVDGRGIAGRLGGDEFAFALHVDDQQGGLTIGQEIIDGIEAIHPGTPERPGLSASIGMVVVNGPVEHAVMAVREADAAMYRAKQAGGGSIVVSEIAEVADPVDAARTVSPVGPLRPIRPELNDDELQGPSDRPPPTWRQRVRRALPLIVTSLVILGVLITTSDLANRAQRHAEQDRVDERRQVLLAVGALTANTSGPDRLMPVAAATPWDPDNPLPTLAVLDQWTSAPALGAEAAVMLVDRTGQTLAAAPASHTAPPAATVDHDGWAAVLAGTAHIPPLTEGDDGRLRFWWNLPIVRDGTVREILVVSAAVEDVSWSEILELLGSLGNRPGGAVVVDSNGRVAGSWNPAQVGEIALDPGLLAPSADGNTLVEGPDDQVTLVERIPDPYSERYILWQKRPADLFGELQRGRQSMDLVLVAVVVFTLLGVAWLYRLRERQLRRHEGRLDALLRHSSTVVLIVDRAGLIEFASSAITRYTGRPAIDSIDSPLARAIGAETADKVGVCHDLTTGERTEIQRVTLSDRNGAPRICDVVIQAMYDRPEIGGCLIAIRDHTDRQRLEDHLSLAAGRDPLTGLLNRASFAAELEELQEDRRSDGNSYAVVFLDLDHFKPINDEHGHHVGDQVLQVLSRRLEAAVRSEDLVARYGGDEFTILIRNCDRPHAEATTDRLLAAIRSPIEIDDDLVVKVGASAGVVLGQPGSSQGGRVLRDADHAMYQAKKGGRDQWVLASA